MLRGASLGAREFVSSNGVLTVMRAVALDTDAGLPLIFSLDVGCTCQAGDGCGAHGSCVSGMCRCDRGYSGAMCDNVDDPCDAIDCGQHGQCVQGSCHCTNRYTGSTCDQAPRPCCSTKGCCADCCSSSFCLEDARCFDGFRSAALEYCDAHFPGWDVKGGMFSCCNDCWDSSCDRSC